jgi:predicted nucleotidyltransferase
MNSNNQHTDLCVSVSEMKIIRGIIGDFASDCDVFAFGSRYKKSSKDYSDLDLAFICKGGEKLGLKRIGQLEYAFAESDLPYSVDVVDYNSISDTFKSIIDSGNEQIYTA